MARDVDPEVLFRDYFLPFEITSILLIIAAIAAMGMTEAMHRITEQAHPAFPVTIYYAFKQAETDLSGTASTGWETLLEGAPASQCRMVLPVELVIRSTTAPPAK